MSASTSNWCKNLIGLLILVFVVGIAAVPDPGSTAPSLAPTATPSIIPSIVPSIVPSRTPSVAPTYTYVAAPVSYSISAYAGVVTNGGGFSGDGQQASLAEFSIPCGVFITTQGSLFIADAFNGRVRKVDTSGIVNNFAGGGPDDAGSGSAPTSVGLSYPQGVWGDSLGQMFILDTNAGHVLKVNSAASIISVCAGAGLNAASPSTSSLGDGGAATAAYFASANDIAGDSLGNLYIADLANNKVRKISATQIVSTIAGTGSGGSSGDNGPATSATIQYPLSVFVDSVGVLFLCDVGGSTIRKVSSGIISTLVGTGGYFFNGDGLPGTSTLLNYPAGLWADSAGVLYFGDAGNSRVRMLASTNGGAVFTVAGTGASGMTGNGGAATAASLSDAEYITGSTGATSLYFSDRDSSYNVVRKLTSTTPTVQPSVVPSAAPSSLQPSVPPVSSPSFYSITTVVGTKSAVGSALNVPATSAGIGAPYGMYADTSGNLYFADYTNRRAKMISASSGLLTLTAGSGSAGVSSGVPATSAAITRVLDVWVDSLGVVYIVDYATSTIRMVSTNGILTLYAGTGSASTSTTATNGDGGKATAATLNFPCSAKGDSVGALYIADYVNGRVRKIDNAGIVSTIGGTGVISTTGNGGPATAATFLNPVSLFVDTSGSVFVTDNGNQIRRIGSNSIVTRLIGVPDNMGFNGDGLAGTSTTISNAWGVWVNSVGVLFFADQANYRVRMLTNTGSSGSVYTLSGSSVSVSTADVDGPATSATFMIPRGLTGQSAGILYVGDVNAVVIRKMTPIVVPSINPTNSPTIAPSAFPSANSVAAPSNYNIHYFAGHYSGSHDFLGDGGAAVDAILFNPLGVWQNTMGTTYIADTSNTVVRVVDTNGIINTYAGISSSSDSQQGVNLYVPLSVPTGLWGDTQGRLYILDYWQCRVYMVDSDASSVFAVLGNGNLCTDPAKCGDGGPATSATLGRGFSIQGDTVGNMFIGDSTDYMIRKVDSQGIITRYAGTGVSAPSISENIPATSTTISYPVGLFVDTIANVYFCDMTGNIIRKVIATTGYISNVVGTGAAGYNGDGLAGTSTVVNNPNFLWRDTNANTFFSDNGNRRFRVSMLDTKLVYTIAGNGAQGTMPADNYPGTSTSFYAPSAIFGNTAGQLLVADADGDNVALLVNVSPTAAPTATPSVAPTVSPSSPPIARYYITRYMGTGVHTSGADGGVASSTSVCAPNGIFVSSTGTFYMVDYDCPYIRIVNAVGIIGTLTGLGTYSSSGDGGPASSAAINGPSSIWGDTVGTMYLTEYNTHCVRKVSVAGIISTVVGICGTISSSSTAANGDDGAATSATLCSPLSAYGDTNGQLFITDSCNHRIRKVTAAGTISTYAGSGIPGYGPDGSAATSCTMGQDYGLFVDKNADVYFTDMSNNVVRQIKNSNKLVTTVLGTTNTAYNGDGLASTSTNIGGPYFAWANSAGTFFAVDYMNRRVRMVTSGAIVYTIAGTGVQALSGDNGPATSASLNDPLGLYGDSLGAVYVSDDATLTVRKMTVIGAPTIAPSATPSVLPTTLLPTTPTVRPSTAPTTAVPSNPPVLVNTFTVSRYAGNAMYGPGTSGFRASATTLCAPFGVWQDSLGKVYISDYDDNRIRTVDTNGILGLFAGTGGSTFTGDTVGAATSVVVSFPNGVWGDSVGNVFIVDYYCAIRKVASGIIRTYAGTPGTVSLSTIGANGDGGQATSSTLNYPQSCWGDSVGRLYIADIYNFRVRRVSASGIITTILGTGVFDYSGDGGAATSATAKVPFAVFPDSVGNFWLSDNGASKIRFCDTAGIVSTVAGTGTATAYADTYIAGTSTELSNPSGMWADSLGNMYFADTDNKVVRALLLTNIVVTIAGNGINDYTGDGGFAKSASFYDPYFLCGNTNGELYVSDDYSCVVRKLSVYDSPTMAPTTAPSALPSVMPTAPTQYPSMPPVVAPTNYLVTTVAGSSSGSSDDGVPATAAQLLYPNGLFSDTGGVFYVAEVNRYKVRKVDTSGIISTLAGTGTQTTSGDGGPASSASIYSSYGVWGNSQGVLYVTETYGLRVRAISYYWQTISTYVGNGVSSTYSSDANGDGGQATAATLNYPIHSYGDSLGTLYICDRGNGKIRMVHSDGIISTIAGTGGSDSTGDGGPATSASFNLLRAIFVDSVGSIYVTQYSGRVRKISSSQIITTILGNEGTYFNGDGLPGTATGLQITLGVHGDRNGNIYVVNISGSRIRMLSSSDIVYTIAGTGSTGYTGDGGYSTAAKFGTLQSIFCDTVGNLIISDSSNAVVRKLWSLAPTSSPSIAPTGTPTYLAVAPASYRISTFAALNHTRGFAGDGGPATSASFYSPYDIWQTTNGVSYIADFNNNRIRVVSSSGIISTFCGNGTGASSGNDGPASSAAFNHPMSVWVDSLGVVFILDYYFQSVRKVTLSSGIVTQFAGSGVASTSTTAKSGDNGPATSATLWYPTNVRGDSAGKLYVADSVSRKIRMISNGIITTFAGTGNYTNVAVGGAATSCDIVRPRAVFPDSVGNVYVTDFNGNRVKKITAGSNYMYTIVGSGRAGFNGDGIAGTSAYTRNPFGLWVDTTGNLLYGDINSRRVKYLSASSGLIYTVAGNGSFTAEGDGLPATSASLTTCFLMGDTLSNIYVADFSWHTVRKLTVTTPAPTFTPTLTPTAYPSESPSVAPSLTPTVVPTIMPSIAPTGAPTFLAVAPVSYRMSTFAALNHTAGFAGDGGPATSASFYYSYDIWQTTDGVSYITDYNNHRLRVVSSSGIINTYAGDGTGVSTGNDGPASSASLYHPMSVWIDSIGVLFITEYDAQLVRKVTLSTGIISSVAGTGAVSTSYTASNGDGGPATSATFWYPANVRGDSVGRLYVADFLSRKIRVIYNGIITTYAGTGNYTTSGLNGAATSCDIGRARGVFPDSVGNVYFTDNLDQRVRKIAAGTGYMSTIVGNGNFAYNGDGIAGTSASTSNPFGLWVDTSGNLYYGDRFCRRVRFLSALSGLIYTVAGNGTTSAEGDGLPATSASLIMNYFMGDTLGNIFLADSNYNTVRKLISTTTASPTALPTTAAPSIAPTIAPTVASAFYISDYAGMNATHSYSGDDGPASAAALNSPYDVGLSTTGIVFIPDINNYRVRVVRPSGIISTFAGNGLALSSADGVDATAASLNKPLSLWVSSTGTLFIVESLAIKVRAISLSTSIITTYAGTGVSSTVNTAANGDGGPATSATLKGPSTVRGDSVGNVYIVDSSYKIRAINSGGIISTVAGTGTTAVSNTNPVCGGAATSCDLALMRGVAVDTGGNLFLSEYSGCRIRKITTNQIITTILGRGSFTYNGDGMPGTSTDIRSPFGVWIDGSNNVVVSDNANYRLRRMDYTTTIVNTIGGNGKAVDSHSGGPATSAALTPFYARGDSVSSIYVAAANQNTIRKLSAVLAVATTAPTMSPSIAPTVVPSVAPSQFPTALPTSFAVAPVSYYINAFSGVNRTSGFAGDGGPASAALLNSPFEAWQNSVDVTYIADYSNNRVRSVDISGIINTFVGDGTATSAGDGGVASAASIYRPPSVWTNSLGDLYVVELGGHRLRKVMLANSYIFTYAGTGTGSTITTDSNGDGGQATSASLRSPCHVRGDSVGTLYIVDQGNYKVRRVSSSGIITTIAGTGSNSVVDCSGAATSCDLAAARAVTLDTVGTLYITDATSNRVRVIAAGSSSISTIMGTGAIAFNGDGQAATSTAINSPFGIWLDSNGNLFVADRANYRIRYMPSLSNLVYTVAGNGMRKDEGDGGLATSASISPNFLMGNTQGSLYVGDALAHTVRKLTNTVTDSPTALPTPVPTAYQLAPLTYLATMYAGQVSPTTGYGGDGGPATSASLAIPNSVWLSPLNNNLLIADSYNNRVRKVDSSGIISIFAGTGVYTQGGSGGPATSANVTYPSAVWGDSLGNIYISELDANIIRIVSSGSSIISIFAGTGYRSDVDGTIGDNGPATSASIYSSYGIMGSSTGTMYIADSIHYRIRAVTNGIITTIAGVGINGHTGDDGYATSARIYTPRSVFCDTVGNVYLTEAIISRLRLVSVGTGIITSIAGNGQSTFNGNGNAATSTAFYNLWGLWADSLASNFFFADYQNKRVRFFSRSNMIVYTVGGTGSNAVVGQADGVYSTAVGLYPAGIVGDTLGNLYVTDRVNNFVVKYTSTATRSPSVMPTVAPSVAPSEIPTVLPTREPTVAPSFQVFAPNAYLVVKVAGDGGSSGFAGDDGPAVDALFDAPYGIWLSTGNDAYVSDFANNRVRKVASSGIISTFVGTGGGHDTGDGGSASSADIACPVSVWEDSLGNFFVVANANSIVRKISTSRLIISTYAGSGSPGIDPADENGDGGAATAATFSNPMGIFGNTLGGLYIADQVNNKLRYISSSGIVSTLVGTGSYYSDGDGGAPTAATLLTCKGVFVDSVGNVYLTEFYRVRWIPQGSGLIYALAGRIDGRAAGRFLGDGMAATSSTFWDLFGVWIDTVSNLFLGDVSNHRVRMITLTDHIAYTVAGTGADDIYGSGDNGSATSATLTPYYVMGDSVGSVWFTDRIANTLRKLININPTFAPTLIPSMSPTFAPSSAPSVIPTLAPTCSPSVGPSVLPSASPSIAPTVLPSNAPSTVPTQSPSLAPSVIPTITPSLTPSETPSVAPSVTPTQNPTAAPSAVPSVVPSVAPSVAPSLTPSAAPSVQPSVAPSIAPTNSPSFGPSVAPSVAPSLKPSSEPTTEPTVAPSLNPSIPPSTRPSVIPIERPSTQPSLGPSEGPSVVPSVSPSLLPTDAPSACPSVTPTVAPSMMPSVNPSVNPTVNPTINPSVEPSLSPTLTPSVSPSVTPSQSPSVVPSELPSVVPSLAPSVSPSVSPSLAPSLLPSVSPSVSPSACPSVGPSVSPSVRPSRLPSQMPTAFPTTEEHRNMSTLPNTAGAAGVSVIGGPSQYNATLLLRIVLPFQQVNPTRGSDAFSNVVIPSSGSFGVGYVVMGQGHLLAASSSLTLSDNLYGQVFSFNGALSSDSVARSVSVLRDFNGDGFSDLIIGDPYASRCYLVLGTARGLTNMTSGFTIFGESLSDLTGWSVSDAGDVNNDTLSDIIIGAPNARLMGAFYVIYGRRQGLYDVSLDSSLNSSTGFAVFGGVKGDYLGLSVSGAGDVNGDGFDDVIAGASQAALYNIGAAVVMFGAKSLHSLPSMSWVNQTLGFKVSGVPFSQLGYSVSGVGDVNGDGYDDVLIGGSPQSSALSAVSYLVYGSPSIASSVSSAGSGLVLSGVPFVQGVVLKGGGGVVVSGVNDINHDGFNDLLVIQSTDFTGRSGFIVMNSIPFSGYPSFTPTRMPTAVPVKRLTNPPTVVSTQKPSASPTTISPSVHPTFRPTAPTESPTQGATAPTSTPSAVPTCPSSVPTRSPVPPTFQPSHPPSEAPTVVPTAEPTAIPTAPTPLPSLSPTLTPTDRPTVQSRPTRLPTLRPTYLPTVRNESAVSVVYLTSSTSSYARSSSGGGSTHFILNSSSSVNITGWGGGRDRFTVLPQPNTTLFIDHFNVSGDLIDLSAFTSILHFSDLVLTMGSVVIHLPHSQFIRLAHLMPANMSADDFVFYQPSDGNDDDAYRPIDWLDRYLTRTAQYSIGSVLVLVIGGFLIYRFGYVSHVRKEKNKKDVERVLKLFQNFSIEEEINNPSGDATGGGAGDGRRRLHMVTFRSNVEGDILCPKGRIVIDHRKLYDINELRSDSNNTSSSSSNVTSSRDSMSSFEVSHGSSDEGEGLTYLTAKQINRENRLSRKRFNTMDTYPSVDASLDASHHSGETSGMRRRVRTDTFDSVSTWNEEDETEFQRDRASTFDSVSDEGEGGDGSVTASAAESAVVFSLPVVESSYRSPRTTHRRRLNTMDTIPSPSGLDSGEDEGNSPIYVGHDSMQQQQQQYGLTFANLVNVPVSPTLARFRIASIDTVFGSEVDFGANFPIANSSSRSPRTSRVASPRGTGIVAPGGGILRNSALALEGATTRRNRLVSFEDDSTSRSPPAVRQSSVVMADNSRDRTDTFDSAVSGLSDDGMYQVSPTQSWRLGAGLVAGGSGGNSPTTAVAAASVVPTAPVTESLYRSPRTTYRRRLNTMDTIPSPSGLDSGDEEGAFGAAASVGTSTAFTAQNLMIQLQQQQQLLQQLSPQTASEVQFRFSSIDSVFGADLNSELNSELGLKKRSPKSPRTTGRKRTDSTNSSSGGGASPRRFRLGSIDTVFGAGDDDI